MKVKNDSSVDFWIILLVTREYFVNTWKKNYLTVQNFSVGT